MNEITLLTEADDRARRYPESIPGRRVFPDAAALQALAAFNEPLPTRGYAAEEVLRLLDDTGSPATVVSNGPSYFGFVGGAALPAAAAAERLMLAWDQCAASVANYPVAPTLARASAACVL